MRFRFTSTHKDPYNYVKDIAKQKLDSVSNYNTDILISLDIMDCPLEGKITRSWECLP